MPLRFCLFLCSLLLAAPAFAAPSLSFTLNERGLGSLSFQGRSLLAADGGALEVVNASPKLRRANGTVSSGSETPTSSTLDARRAKVTRTYAWGRVSAAYWQQGDALKIRLGIANASRDTIASLNLRVAELLFPAPPRGTTLDAGMFGTGGMHPLHEYPLWGDPKLVPPLVAVDYGSGLLAWCSDDARAPVTVGVPNSSNGERTQFPFWASGEEIRPGSSAVFDLSLRFAPPGRDALTLAPEVLQQFAALHPFRLKWNDRRAIGTFMLASSGNNAPLNPRRWIINNGQVDVTTPAGRQAFARDFMAYAQNSIKILKEMNAQGMVTWDIEGQQWMESVYYGDPRLVTRLAPEMETPVAVQVSEKKNGKTSTRTVMMPLADAYFRAFREAGLRVGVCVRPQQIRFAEGKPVQDEAGDAARVLNLKIAYARKRWGCTLFYMDSTVDKTGALSPDVLGRVAQANPGVLLMPENETLRDYAFSAPLNSFMHHQVTSTPPGARAVYPRAFSTLLAHDGDFDLYRQALVDAVRRGDILLFQGWWPNPANTKIKAIYEEAARPAPPRKP